jgi:arylsulfatase A-like enzyme/Flp pilus assembly protein TadD
VSLRRFTQVEARAQAGPSRLACPVRAIAYRLLRLVGLLVAAIVLVGSISCRSPDGTSESPDPPAAPGGTPSVLLITIDTLRADAIGAYGQRSAPTPWIDRLAAGGVRFDDAHAHNVVTLPSHANILSGRYPVDHGVRDNSGFRFPPELETLASILGGRGYATAAFVSAFPLDSRFGLDRGFDLYEDSFAEVGELPTFLEQERPGAETVALARRWLEEQQGSPVFCWVHLFDPHFPYAPGEPYGARFPDSAYLGEVAATDAALAPLLEPLLEAGEHGRTLVVLTSDHGESLGEHGEATHGIFAYEATLRVPLVLYWPALLEPAVVSEPVRHVDVMPTVLEALSLPAPADLRGRSLLAVARGESAGPAPPSYFEALSGQLNRGWAPLFGIVRDHTKYIDLPIPELYDLHADRRERTNLAARSAQELGELDALLGRIREADRGGVRSEASAETRRRLASLGYLSAGGPERGEQSYTVEDDPKRLIALDGQLQEVVGLYLDGDLSTALAKCRELVRRRPEMPVALLQLGLLERENGDLAAAADALLRVLALDPEDPVALALLGSTLSQAGRAGEAAELLEPHTRKATPDLDVLLARGLALAKAGRPEESLATFARAREVDPSNAMVLVHVGTVRLMQGDREGARRAFEEAVAMNSRVTRAHSSLGVMAAESGRASEAIEHWRNAVALDPEEHEKILAVGMRLRSLGREREARPYLEFFVSSAPRELFGPAIERVSALLAASRGGDGVPSSPADSTRR